MGQGPGEGAAFTQAGSAPAVDPAAELSAAGDRKMADGGNALAIAQLVLACVGNRSPPVPQQ